MFDKILSKDGGYHGGCLYNLTAHGELFPGTTELDYMSAAQVPPPGTVSHTDHSLNAVHAQGVDGRHDEFACLAAGDRYNSKFLAYQRVQRRINQGPYKEVAEGRGHIILPACYRGIQIPR